METPKETILIIEDDAGLIELLSENIQQSGFKTVSVSSANEALGWLKTNTPDLILLDFSLPDMTGEELILHLKNTSANVPPFVVSTGRGDERTAVEMMKLGARDYIVKDTHFLELIPIVVNRVCNDIQNENKLKIAEQALLKNNYHLAESQRITLTGTWELDLITGCLLWSDEIFRIFEINSSEFGATYDAFLNAIHPDDREMVDKAFSDSLQTKMPYQMDHRLLMWDGRIKYVSEQCETTFDAKGKPLVSIGIVQDISIRKQAELNLTQSREEFKDLFDSAPIGYHEIDLEGRITRINQTELNMLGYTYDELNGQFIWEFVADKAYSFEVTKEKLKNHQLNSTPYEREFVRKDGKRLPILVVDKLIIADNGEVTGIRSSIQDISEQKRTEEVLKLRETYLTAIIENLPGMIWLKDVDSHLLMTNTNFAHTFGSEKPEDLLGKTDLEFSLKEHAEKYLADDKKVVGSLCFSNGK